MKMKFALIATALLASSAYAVAPTAFGICGACHAVVRGQSGGMGPNLAGVYGRKAGTLAGYEYSSALKAKHVVWNAATLDKWLTSPQAFVPGTKMSYAGQSDPAKRAQIIAYLKTLK